MSEGMMRDQQPKLLTQQQLIKLPSGAPPPDPRRTPLLERFINGYLDGEVRIMFGLVPVGGAIVTLLGTAMAFKAACTWEKARALPGPEAPAPVHVRASRNAHRMPCFPACRWPQRYNRRLLLVGVH